MTFYVIALLAIIAQGWLLFLAFFEPGLAYKIRRAPNVKLDTPEFARMMEVLVKTQMNRRTKVEVLTNGEVFYEAQLAAIGKAQHSVNLEAYIFQRGEVTRRFIRALAERARAGVHINVVVDAIGSFLTTDSYFKELTDAGGKVFWYHPIRWYTLPR